MSLSCLELHPRSPGLNTQNYPGTESSIFLVIMAAGSAVRTIRSQAVNVAEQSEQQSKLEMSARWRGLAEAYAIRGIGVAINPDPNAAQFLQEDQATTLQNIAKLDAELGRIMVSERERAALAAASGPPSLPTDTFRITTGSKPSCFSFSAVSAAITSEFGCMA